jgi:UDPglucose 6-dehydrogenase
MNISVIGLGKVGSAMVAVFASKGFRVWGFDIDEKAVATLRAGNPVVPEPMVSELLRDHQNNTVFTNSIEEVIANTDVSFIIVPTPSDNQGFFVTSYVEDAIKKLVDARIKNKKHVIVVSSTVMPGSMSRMSSKFYEEMQTDCERSDFQFVYSPEFIALGNVVGNLLEPQFCLIGSDEKLLDSNKWGAKLTIRIKRHVTSNAKPVHSVTFESAEIAKISCNTFLTTKIAYANLIAQMVSKIPRAKSSEVFSVLHSDDRIGQKFFNPGLGYGGPCLPRDNKALGGLLETLQISSQIPLATHDFNESLVEQFLNSSELTELVSGEKILILGLAYKNGTSSLIESQALKISLKLSSIGVKVRAHDFEVDFSRNELSFLDYGSNILDLELLENSKMVFIALGDDRYADFVQRHIKGKIKYLDPWAVVKA